MDWTWESKTWTFLVSATTSSKTAKVSRRHSKGTRLKPAIPNQTATPVAQQQPLLVANAQDCIPLIQPQQVASGPAAGNHPKAQGSLSGITNSKIHAAKAVPGCAFSYLSYVRPSLRASSLQNFFLLALGHIPFSGDGRIPRRSSEADPPSVDRNPPGWVGWAL